MLKSVAFREWLFLARAYASTEYHIIHHTPYLGGGVKGDTSEKSASLRPNTEKKTRPEQWIEYRWRDERMSVCGILTAITPLDNIKAQAQAKALMVGFAGAEFTMGQGGRG